MNDDGHCRCLSSCLKCPQACKSQQMKMSKVCSEMCLRKRCATAPQETTSSNETLQPERIVINHDVCTSGSYTGFCTNSSTKLDCLLLILNVVLTRFSALTFRIEFLGGSARLTTRTPRVSYLLGSGFLDFSMGFQLASRVASG